MLHEYQYGVEKKLVKRKLKIISEQDKRVIDIIHITTIASSYDGYVCE